MLYGNNDKSSRQIFYAVLVETPICPAKGRIFFLGLLVIASLAAQTTSVGIDAVYLFPLACVLQHFLFLQTV
jgi:hypothetical protein